MKRLWLVVILAALPLVGQGQKAQAQAITSAAG